MKYFLDTEFIDHSPKGPIILLSIGLVAEDERAYYAQMNHDPYPDISDWIARHVTSQFSHFHMGDVRRECIAQSNVVAQCDKGCSWRTDYQLSRDIRSFCDPTKYGPPEFWGYFADYDWVVFCGIFGGMFSLPEGYPQLRYDIAQEYDKLHLTPPKNPTIHHALSDALWTRDCYHILEKGKS